jgi:hypothetical protein
MVPLLMAPESWVPIMSPAVFIAAFYPLYIHNYVLFISMDYKESGKDTPSLQTVYLSKPWCNAKLRRLVQSTALGRFQVTMGHWGKASHSVGGYNLYYDRCTQRCLPIDTADNHLVSILPHPRPMMLNFPNAVTL